MVRRESIGHLKSVDPVRNCALSSSTLGGTFSSRRG
jgi:hypothetical protein